MIVRIVKMTFHPEHVETFRQLFDQKKEKIRSFSGCSRLELLKMENEPVFFTYSYWDSEESLYNYRHSELFNATWADTKALFSARPEAWSTRKEVVLT